MNLAYRSAILAGTSTLEPSIRESAVSPALLMIYSRLKFVSSDCGNTISNGATQYANPASACNMACAGNANETCGGGNALTLYYANKAAPAQPIDNPGPPGFSLLGCYTDSVNSRTLITLEQYTGSLTVAVCCNACAASGYKYAGVEYANECYCGNSFTNGGGPAPDGEIYCNMLW